MTTFFLSQKNSFPLLSASSVFSASCFAFSTTRFKTPAVFLHLLFHDGLKNPPAMQGTWVRSLGWEDSPGEGKGYTLHYSGLENSMDCIVHWVPKSRTRLSDFHFHSMSKFKFLGS